jgi:hypothetical protein
MDSAEVQRLNFAIQAAMRAVHNRGGGIGQEWATQQSGAQLGEGQLDDVRNRVKAALRDRVAQRLQERLSEVMKERVREVVRERLGNELRGCMLDAQSERGFDFSRLEKRLTERLSDVTQDQVMEAIRKRAREVVRERLSDSIERPARSASKAQQRGGSAPRRPGS